jgi:hypothetical protein
VGRKLHCRCQNHDGTKYHNMKRKNALSTVAAPSFFVVFDAYGGEPLPDGGVVSASGIGVVKAGYELDLPRFDSASLMRNTSHQGERLLQRYTMKSLDMRRCGLR